jgi:hypothetical protein
MHARLTAILLLPSDTCCHSRLPRAAALELLDTAPEEQSGAHPPRVQARPPRPSSPQVHGITIIASMVEPSSGSAGHRPVLRGQCPEMRPFLLHGYGLGVCDKILPPRWSGPGGALEISRGQALRRPRWHTQKDRAPAGALESRVYPMTGLPTEIVVCTQG